jgi:DNA-binding response OmpR family regulator
MVVHTDSAFEQVLSAQIQQRGFTPVVCSARAALRDTETLQPRAFVLDWDVPDIDCLDLIESLCHGREARLLVCSRLDHSTELESLGTSCSSQWLRTPCTWESLVSALDSLLAG